MRILIVHREFNEAGGIGGLYKALRKQFTLDIDHFECGSRSDESKSNKIYMIYRLLRDYVLFAIKINFTKYDIIHINPTLDFKSSVRDALFVILAKSNKRKIIVHFHGWFPWFEIKIKGFWLSLFKYAYNKCNLFMVLSSHKRKCLESWGFIQPILLMANAVDIDITKDIDIKSLIQQRADSKSPEILFLSRIHKEKGIFETVDALPKVFSSFPNAKLIVGGDGHGLNDMKEAARNIKHDNIEFLGYVKLDRKTQVFSRAYAYILPSYSEGLPISVLEAMSFGLPVIVTAVGGIPDFFINGKHGILIDKADHNLIADAMIALLKDKRKYIEIAYHNLDYAQQHFLSPVFAQQLEGIYTRLYKGWQ